MQLQAGRGAVAAVAHQVLGARVERGDQVEAGDAACRSARAITLDREQDRGPPVALGEARRRDTDDARMPALAGEHERVRLGLIGRQLRARGLGGRGDLALRRTALGVGTVELRGDLRRPIIVGRQHQLDSGVGAIEAPGGVDPGSEPEPDGLLVDRLGLHLRNRHQRADPSAPRRPHRGQPLAHQPPVLADERHQVGDRRQRNQVEILSRGVPPAPGRVRVPGAAGVAKRDRELVGHPRGAQGTERVARDDRVQDRAIGQLGGRLVVVGHDHLDARGASRRDLLRRRDSAVHRDRHLRAAGANLLDARERQPVAVAQPVGDQPVALGAELAQHRDEDRRRADPVDVVVAVHGHPPAVPGDREHSLADVLHPVEGEGVVVVARLEEVPGLLDRPIAAPHEHHSDRLGQVEGAGKPARLRVVVGLGAKCASRCGGGGHPTRLSSPADGIAGAPRKIPRNPGPAWAPRCPS